MLWLVCSLTAIVLVAIGIKMYLGDRSNVSRAVIILGCLFAATYIAYIPPFYYAYGVFAGTVGNLIHTLQIVTVDADVTQYYDIIYQDLNTGVVAQGYIALLSVLHICLPAISALSAVTVLLRCFSSLQLFFANRHKRPMFIFSEANERALHLAKSLLDIKCDIVFAGGTAEALDGEFQGKKNFVFKEDAISDLTVKTRKGKDIYFFCISEDEDESLSHTLQLIERFAEISEDQQEYVHIYQFSKHQDFTTFVDSSNKNSLDVQCVNEYELQVYNLLDKYPLMQYGRSGVHVLLHGLSEMNIVVLKAIAWCGQISNFALRISVVGIDIAPGVQDLQLKVPGLFTERYDIRFYDCKTEKEIEDAIRKECMDANYIIVGEKSDNATMELGILLRRLFYRLDPAFAACPPIFCYVKEPAKFSLIKNLTTAEANPKRKINYDLIPFGSLEEVYTYKQLVDSPLEKLAKNVHLAYEEIFSDGEFDVKGALKRYNIFEVNKRSNRANALHIRYKLNMLGLDYTEDTQAEAVRLEDSYTEEALEKMSIAEHNRWMAFLETEGWIPSTREEVLSYRESGISRGRHNCPILKMHPYICEYDKLKELSLELEGKDTTVYDKELIIRIPDILGDKWSVTGKKYVITKMK